MGPTSRNFFSSWSQSVSSSFQGIISSIGKTWQGEDAQKAFDAGNLCSISVGADETNTAIRVVFRNLTPIPLLLCWVSEQGILHHFYRLNPWVPPTDISHAEYHDALADFMSKTDHTEHTHAGHAFCWACVANEDDLPRIRSIKSLEGFNAKIVGGYRPYLPKRDNDNKVQLVEISHNPQPSKEKITCYQSCFERPGNLRKGKMEDDGGDEPITCHGRWNVRAGWGKFDMTPVDTTNKVYEEITIGGWPCCVEPDWSNGDKDLEKRLAEDLMFAANYLPDHAETYLKKHCKIWINKSLTWGPRACPVKGMALCYHPDQRWLIENGLHVEKYQCVEINCASFYKKDCHYWGPGGLFLHELSHAYHHSLLPDGYQNRDIEDCFQKAMKDGLYEKVQVHGPQGPTARAYACANAMEYWAELSTAFLGGLNKKEEFNKWYPFNRQQLKDHDPRAFDLLSRLWGQDAVVKKRV
ncbi:hypothetical protein IV203_026077 [Nitzschia inconspicua]|uniref:Uncharacterized protein n=1 Tax=Nitzschia inconspicua TaxID=303405 RepID=A0A9K3LIF7_9STRA|nr:hypothetical protein IV203_026077 [Nitzschia inconspicua]